MSVTDDLVKRARDWDGCWPSKEVERLVPAMADRIEALTAERDALAESLEKVARALSLTRRADDLREAYHRLPNDKNRIGDKRSKKSHARDAWLRAFRKAAREARAALRATEESE